MKFNTIKTVVITGVALVTVASSGAAFAGSSPFCFGGSPTPKYICDTIKANQKPKHVVGNPNLTTYRNSGRVFGR